MLKFSAVHEQRILSWSDGQVGKLAESKLSYFIHLHQLHSEQWAEFVESTKYNSHSKLLQTNDHRLLLATKQSLAGLYALFSHVLYCEFVSDSNRI